MGDWSDDADFFGNADEEAIEWASDHKRCRKTHDTPPGPSSTSYGLRAEERGRYSEWYCGEDDDE